MNLVKTQFGKSASFDTELRTWSFLMPGRTQIVSGDFAIVDIEVYNRMKSLIDYVDKECSVGSMTADLSHDFVDGVRNRLDALNIGVKW